MFRRAIEFHSTRWVMAIDPLTLLAVLESFQDTNDHNGANDVLAEVKVLDLQDNEICTLTITTPQASRPEIGLISCLSPLGSALLNKAVGDVVEIMVLGAKMRYQVLAVKGTC